MLTIIIISIIGYIMMFGVFFGIFEDPALAFWWPVVLPFLLGTMIGAFLKKHLPK